MLFCIRLPNFHPNRTTYCGNITSCRFFKIATAAAQYYFRIPICWCHCLQKVKVYQQSKFRPHISIDGWDITTSVFEKQISAILEIYFRFRFRPFPKSAHYSTSEYRISSKSKHPLQKYDVISISQDGGRDGWILLLVSYLFMSCLQNVKVY